MKTDLYNILSKVANSIENADQLAVPFLANKAAQYSKTMPHDKTVGMLSILLAKLLENNKGFISKSDFKTLFSKSFVNGTRAKELFANELGLKEIKQVKTASKSYDTELKIEAKDDVLTTSLKDAFSGNVVRSYSEKLAQRAVSKVSKSLDIWGMKPSKLFVSAGNEKYLVIQADYETPKGVTSVHIPVETVDDNIIEAFVFVGNASPEELNNINLKNYIKSNAGNKLSLNSNMLLGAFDKIASKNEISNAEMALIRLNAKKNAHTEFASGNITGLSIDAEPVKDVQEIKFEEAKSFEEKFANVYGEAALKFGSDKLKLSRDIIVRHLNSCGHKNPQLKLNKISDNTLFYAVSLGSVAFTAPIKVENNLVQLPTILISNGSVKPFNIETIKELYKENIDSKASAIASPLYDLKASDLILTIRDSVSEKNLQKAEDALNVLANSGNAVDYAKGFQAFMSGLSVKKAAVEHKCSRILKTSSSQHPVCGHTGLSLDKVYQDSHGDCRPKYRQTMNDTFEGVLSMDSKVFI